jgi:hypothetical protein
MPDCSGKPARAKACVPDGLAAESGNAGIKEAGCTDVMHKKSVTVKDVLQFSRNYRYFCF